MSGPPMLAQANDSTGIIVWSGVLFGVVLLLFMAVSWIRRRLRGQEDDPSAGFSLGDLRELHRKGELSDEEYERARARIVAGAKAAMLRDAEKKQGDASERS